jgi:hypothetical protein
MAATMNTRILTTAALTIGLLASAGAPATPVTTWEVDVFTRFDTATVLPAGVTVVNNQSLRWGTSTGFGQSGLDITDSPSITYVNTNGAAVPNVSVTHLNRPITGTSLASVNILSTLILTPFVPAEAGLPAATITFGILFEETPNGANPCAGGGANGVGVNINGCADIFVIDQAALNFPFFYPDPDDNTIIRQYFISFFEASGGLNPLPAAACTAAGAGVPCIGFRTPEREDTTFQFAALITTEPVRIPEPGALALVGLVLGAMGLVRRRRHG